MTIPSEKTAKEVAETFIQGLKVTTNNDHAKIRRFFKTAPIEAIVEMANLPGAKFTKEELALEIAWCLDNLETVS